MGCHSVHSSCAEGGIYIHEVYCKCMVFEVKNKTLARTRRIDDRSHASTSADVDPPMPIRLRLPADGLGFICAGLQRWCSSVIRSRVISVTRRQVSFGRINRSCYRFVIRRGSSFSLAWHTSQTTCRLIPPPTTFVAHQCTHMPLLVLEGPAEGYCNVIWRSSEA